MLGLYILPLFQSFKIKHCIENTDREKDKMRRKKYIEYRKLHRRQTARENKYGSNINQIPSQNAVKKKPVHVYTQ